MKQQLNSNSESSEKRKSNIGVRMTILYAIVYTGFVVLSVFFPTLMGVEFIFGLNLAIGYGLALIIIAIIFAFVYNALVKIPSTTGITQRLQKTSTTVSKE